MSSGKPATLISPSNSKVFSEIYSEKLPKELSRKKKLKCDFKTQLDKIETSID